MINNGEDREEQGEGGGGRAYALTLEVLKRQTDRVTPPVKAVTESETSDVP